MTDFAEHGMIAYQIHRRIELIRWAAGDKTMPAPGTAIKFEPRPEPPKAPYAGKAR